MKFITTDKHQKEFQVSEEDRDLVEEHLTGKGKWRAILDRRSVYECYIERYVTALERDLDPSLPRHFLLHRVIADRMELDSTNQIDHIDGDPLNNQRDNLRAATRSQNGMNRTKRVHASSQYLGVYWLNDCKRWRAMGTVVSKRRFHIGCFLTEIEAAKAYDNFAREHYGEFARLNLSGTEQ